MSSYDLQSLCDLIGLTPDDLEIENISQLQPQTIPKTERYYEITDLQFRALQKIIAEIARWAMMDLSILRNHLGKSEGIGSRTFHTRTFNDWVYNKSKAVLLPYDIHPDWIKRVSMSILNKPAKKENQDEKKWKKEDSFQPSILYLGEILRLGGGMNSITPSRYVDTGINKLIVSSMPTSWLRKEIEGIGKIFLSGIMRFVESGAGQKFLQGIHDYVNVPVDIKDLIESNYSDDSGHDYDNLRMDLEELIRKSSTGISFIKFREEIEIDETELEIMKWEQYSSQSSWENWHLFNLNNSGPSKMIPYRPLKIGRYGNVRYYVALPKDKSSSINPQSGSVYPSEVFEYYYIPAEWQKYVIRIFHEFASLVKLDSNRMTLRNTPPMCGYRMLNAFGAQYNKRSNNHPKHYFSKDSVIANNLIDFLQKYCLYSEVEG